MVATVPELIRSAAERFGDRPFLVTPDHVLSFAEAEARSARFARHLFRAGIGRGSHVGLLFPQGPDAVVALLGVTRIGATAVPLSTFARGPEVRTAIRQAGLHALVVPATLLGRDVPAELEALWPSLDGAAGPELYVDDVPSLRRVWVCGGDDRPWTTSLPPLADLDDDPVVGEALLAAAEAAVVPADPMVVVFTSGATAEPKGVVHGHGAQVRQSEVLADLYGFDGSERTFTTMPFFWVGGLTVTLLTHLHRGGTVITVERTDVEVMLDLVRRSSPTRLVGWMLLERLLAAPGLTDDEREHLVGLQTPSLRHPGRRHASLGMTETGGPHTAPPAAIADVELPEDRRGSFGPPVPGFEHRIVDPDTGLPLPDGEEGEICVRGDRMMIGILGHERHETFDRDGWYHTGDRGRLEHGLLFFTGRRSAMIKSGGANVAPAEVEEAVRALPGVGQAFVVGLPDPEREQVVGCLVCPEAGQELEASALAAQLRERLASYKVPRRIVVVAPGEVPVLPSGKVSLPRVVELLLAP